MSDLPEASRFLIYQVENRVIKIDVRFQDETVWLTQQAMAELFQSTVPNISMHLRNIFAEGELRQEATVQNHLTVRQEGARQVSRNLDHYNLDAIISVGYRVKSRVATQFRIWATQRLREYIVKGFVLDDERLKNPDLPFDHSDELLRRIQDIRTSERRFYQKITDVCATSIDYDPTDDASLVFFKTMQNKMHWAIAGQTAAEIVHTRADSAIPSMGLTYRRGPMVRKQDVAIAMPKPNRYRLSLRQRGERSRAARRGGQSQAEFVLPGLGPEWLDRSGTRSLQGAGALHWFFIQQNSIA